MLNNIISDFKDFIDFFTLKYKYDNRGILKKIRMRSGLNKQLSEDEWYRLFIVKSALNHCAKLLLIKYWEDNGKITSKINKAGLDKWKNFVSNIGDKVDIVYEIAEKDCGKVEELKRAFIESEYDIYKIDEELAAYIVERLIKYDLKGYPNKVIYEIFNQLYYDDKRTSMNLQLFYKPAGAIEHVLSLRI